MSYNLHMRFEPAVPRARFMRHFEFRRRYAFAGSSLACGNPDTGVEFAIHVRSGRSLLGRPTVREARLELNYLRPSFFALEAELELSAMIGAFSPRIEDPQMHGMGRGPYSREAFMRGWTFGNEFVAHVMLAKEPQARFPSLPGSRLEAAWRWNYENEARNRKSERQFAPHIKHLWVDGSAAEVAVWPLGMPVLLPKVDYVLVGRNVGGEKAYGLAPWTEVTDIVARAGIAADGDLLDIDYDRTPAPIVAWVRQMPLIDLDDLPLEPFELIDTEALEAARRMTPD